MRSTSTKSLVLASVLFTTAAHAQSTSDLEKLLQAHRATPTQELATKMDVGGFGCNDVDRFIYFNAGPRAYFPDPVIDSAGHVAAQKVFFKRLEAFLCALKEMPNASPIADSARDRAIDAIEELFLPNPTCGSPSANLSYWHA